MPQQEQIQRPLIARLLFWCVFLYLTTLVNAKIVYIMLGVGSRNPGWLDYFHLWYSYSGNTQIFNTLVLSSSVFYGIFALITFLAYSINRASAGKRSLHGNTAFATARQAKKMGLYEDQELSIILGQINNKIIRANDVTPLILIAPTRSGKGTGQIIPNLIAWQGSVVAYDPKIELYQSVAGYRHRCGHDVYLFAPGLSYTHRWNPFDMWDLNDPQLIDNITLMATVICPTPPDAKDPMWTQEAQKFFVGVALALYDLGQYVSLPAIAAWIDMHPPKAADDKGQFEEGCLQWVLVQNRERISELAYRNLLHFAETPPQTRGGIKSQLTSSLSVFASPSVGYAFSGSDFDIRTLRKKKQSLFIGSSKRTLNTSTTAFNLFFQTVITMLAEQLPGADEPHKVLCLFDEFTALGPMASIKRAISDVAGYNLRIFIIIQNLSQLSNTKMYGQEGMMEFMSNMQHQTYYRPTTIDDAKKLSELLGDTTVKSVSDSRPGSLAKTDGYSQSVSDQKRALLLPQEIMRMKDDEMIVNIPGKPPILAKKLVYYSDKRFAGRYLNVRDPLSNLEMLPPLVPVVPEFAEKLNHLTSNQSWFGTEAILPDRQKKRTSSGSSRTTEPAPAAQAPAPIATASQPTKPNKLAGLNKATLQSSSSTPEPVTPKPLDREQQQQLLNQFERETNLQVKPDFPAFSSEAVNRTIINNYPDTFIDLSDASTTTLQSEPQQTPNPWEETRQPMNLESIEEIDDAVIAADPHQ